MWLCNECYSRCNECERWGATDVDRGCNKCEHATDVNGVQQMWMGVQQMQRQRWVQQMRMATNVQKWRCVICALGHGVQVTQI